MKNIPWWKKEVIYQIYPQSFKDSNNDGIGDINGVISKLDYLKELGIGGIWLSPMYVSPLKDNGYDVEDYYDINPMYGSLADMDNLIQEGKKRDIKIIMDLITNHTSTEHEWFKKAISSKENEYQDFYVFADKPDDKKSVFGGSAWEYIPSIDKYYYHYFAVEQADLNWKNPRVRDEVCKIVNFWLERGVGGFRLDAIELIGKELENNVIANGPKIHDYLREISEKTFNKYPDCLSVGEGWPTPEIAIEYCKEEHKELSMMFQFETVALDWGGTPFGKLKQMEIPFKQLKDVFSKWQVKLMNDGWNTLFWENHDLPRSVSRQGNDSKYHYESALALLMILAFQKGTMYIYQGQEIGMANAGFTKLEQYKDIDALGNYKDLVEERKLISSEDYIKGLGIGSRDNSRTPMQWDSSKYAGFSNSEPWLGITNRPEINVEDQLKDPNSVLNFYKNIIKLRTKDYADLLVLGDYEDHLVDDENVYCYQRTYKNKSIITLVNFSSETVNVSLDMKIKKLIVSNYKDTKQILSKLELRAYESVAFEVEV